jgi:putative spermidine/putrescine transport system ATP-binding protein
MSKPAGKDCPPRPGEACEAGIYLGPHRKPFVRCAHPNWRRPDKETAVASTQATTKDRAPKGEAISEDVDVRLTGVSKHYGEVVAVESLDLEVRRGEFFTMLGPSGSGKTTTLRMIAGFEEPDTGRVELAGTDVTGLPPYDRSVNTVFQDYALFPHMTVGENVQYGLRVKGVSKEERRRRASEALATVRLAGYETRKPNQLSGGQQQRVALARAIVNEPRVLLLDEPLGALDLKLREQMQVELKSIKGEVGITFIYVTHDQEEALTMSDRIAVFNNGRVEQIGTPEEVYERPDNPFVAGFVGVSNLLERDGQRFTVRPEKIFFVENGKTPKDLHVEEGTVKDVLYAGVLTRYLVDLAAGGELQVVRQNLETTSLEVQALRGQKVKIGWRADQTVAVKGEEEGK